MTWAGDHRKKWTPAERAAIHGKTGGRCAYCGEEITVRGMQVDHVIPMEFYRVYEAEGIDLNGMDNLLPACKSCNNYKRSLTLEKFRTALERMPMVLERDSVTYRIAARFRLVVPQPHAVKFYFEKLRDGEVDHDDT